MPHVLVWSRDEKLLSVEAEAAVREISFTVDHVSVSTSLPNNSDIVYLNIRTKVSASCLVWSRDEKLLSVEAEAAVREISFTVDHVSVSTSLPNNSDIVYLNIRTKVSASCLV